MREAVIFDTGYLIETTQMATKPVGITANAASIALYESAFKTHFKGLHSYACTIIKDDVMAEEMVQNVFYRLWKNKESLGVHQSLAAYLYKSVHNESLNYLKHLKVRSAYEKYAMGNTSYAGNATDRVRLKDLQHHLDIALNELPEQCRTIFQLSRFEELKYLEIADRLGISVKTVENQMGKALKILRARLADFLPIIIFLLLNL